MHEEVWCCKSVFSFGGGGGGGDQVSRTYCQVSLEFKIKLWNQVQKGKQYSYYWWKKIYIILTKICRKLQQVKHRSSHSWYSAVPFLQLWCFETFLNVETSKPSAKIFLEHSVLELTKDDSNEYPQISFFIAKYQTFSLKYQIPTSFVHCIFEHQISSRHPEKKKMCNSQMVKIVLWQRLAYSFQIRIHLKL